MADKEVKLIDTELLRTNIAQIAKAYAKSDKQKALVGRILFMIDNMPTIEVEPVNGWISVDDRLPEKSGRHLVHTSCIANYRPLKDNVFVAGFVNRDWVFEGWESNLVTHWQSLPTPPKGE